MHLLLPACKSHSHSTLISILVVRAGLGFHVVVDCPVVQWSQLNAPWVLPSPYCTMFRITFHFMWQSKMFRLSLPAHKKSCLVWSNWISYPELRRNVHNSYTVQRLLPGFYLIELADKQICGIMKINVKVMPTLLNEGVRDWTQAPNPRPPAQLSSSAILWRYFGLL